MTTCCTGKSINTPINIGYRAGLKNRGLITGRKSIRP